MDWTDFVFPAKHVMDKIGESGYNLMHGLAEKGTTTHDTQSVNPANQDIGKMAQDQAIHDRPDLYKVNGAGAPQQKTPCPTCGK